MNLTDNETLKFLKGSPVLLDDICAVYPVTIGEIVDEGYDNFQNYLSILIFIINSFLFNINNFYFIKILI